MEILLWVIQLRSIRLQLYNCNKYFRRTQKCRCYLIFHFMNYVLVFALDNPPLKYTPNTCLQLFSKSKQHATWNSPVTTILRTCSVYKINTQECNSSSSKQAATTLTKQEVISLFTMQFLVAQQMASKCLFTFPKISIRNQHTHFSENISKNSATQLTYNCKIQSKNNRLYIVPHLSI